MSKFKISNILPLLFFFLAMVLFIGMNRANATEKKMPKPMSQLQQQQMEMEQHQKQLQDQMQEMDQKQQQQAIADASANNEGVEQSVNVEGADYRAAATAYAAGSYTNMECGATASASKQDVSEGFSLSSIIPWWASRQLRDCWRRDDANWMDSMGLHNEAVESRCATRSMLIKYKTQEECYSTLIGSMKVRQKLETDLEKVTKERDTALVILKERDIEKARLKQEVEEKRFYEAVSK